MKRNGKRTGAAALVESLERAGVEVVFGYPGGNVVSVFDCLRTARFRFVLGRHEQGCVHMADGYARASGRPGVVIVTSGPGLTNTITGLGAANLDGVPIVLICGQVPLEQIGTDAFQEADTTGLTRAVTKHNFLVHSADEIPETVAQAFYIATHGKPGPVVIDLPQNIQRELTLARYPERVSLRAYHPEAAATTAQVNRLAKLLNAARRPVVYAGGGVIAANAAADVAALAHKAGIPVATTLMGIGAFDETDPLALGMAGVYGVAAANAALAEADLVLALGVRFNDRVTGPKPSGFAHGRTIVQVDCDPSSLNKNVTVALGIVADIKDLLTVVDSRVQPNARSGWRTRIAELKRKHPLGYQPLNRATIMPQAVVETLAEVAKGDLVLVSDVGQHQMCCAQYFRRAKPRQFLSSGGMGAMGFAIPAAVGAAVARPDRKVVAVMGDGGAQMTTEELMVAVQERLPITFVVVNNRRLGMVRQGHREQLGGEAFATTITSPDFVRLAQAYGLRALRVSKPGLLAEKLKWALGGRKPTLIEVQVDPDAEV